MVLKVIFICLFVLFLFSPQFKNHPWLANYPDSTVILSVLLMPWFYIQYVIWKKRQHPAQRPFWTAGTLTIVGLTIWLLISLLWAPQTPYSLSKALSFALFTLHAFLIAKHQLGRDHSFMGLFYKIMFLFSSVVLIETLRIKFFPSPGEQLNNIFGNNYLVTGQTLGVGALLSFAGAVPSHKVKVINVGFLLVFLLHVMALLILGARGPVLATFIAVGLLGAVLAYRNKITMTWRGVGLLGLGGCAVCITALFLLNNSLQFATLHRFAALFERLDYSTLDRLSYYKSAFSVFMQHVWKGVGIGGWPHWFGLGDLPWHPHNIVLETAAELGVVGLLLLGYLLYQTFQGCYWIARYAKQSIDLIPVGLWLFAFINALKTGDLNDNILLFGAAGLVQGVRRFARQTKSTL